MRTSYIVAAALAILGFSVARASWAATPKTSRVYLTAEDYKDGRLSFEGDCRSRVHRLELHDVLNKSYIHVTHGGEKRRYAKSDLFGFRACNGRDYRFVSNLEYQILERKDLYIYGREIWEHHGKVSEMVPVYYFSAGPDGQVRELTLENLRQTFPDNHKFQDSLDATFSGGHRLSEYDRFHRMFKVNWVLIASREQAR